MFECTQCAKMFPEQNSYDEHMAGDEHKTKVSDLTFPENPSGASTTLTNGVAAAGSKCNGMVCDLCNLSFDSIEKLMAHAVTREHALNVMQSNQNSNVASNSNSVDNVTISSEHEILPGFDDVSKAHGQSCSSCDVCGKNFSGPEPYQQHLNSIPHKRNVELQKKTAEVSSDSSLFCETCKISCSGPIPYVQHMESESHRRKLKQLEIIQMHLNKADSSPNFEGSNISMNSVLVCETCKVNCSGQIPYLQHMNSEAHRKKLRQLEVLQKYLNGANSSQRLEESNVSLNQVVVCKTCNITCSGQIPYMQHMNSEAHRKKLRQLEVLKEFLNGADSSQKLEENVSLNQVVVCETCNITCSGQIPYIQHMNSEGHRKKLRQQQDAQKYMNETDSLPKLEERNIASSESTRPWFCTVCNKQCTGDVPYQQHLSGANHHKNVKKAEALKNYIKPDDSLNTTVGDDKKIENCILPSFVNGLDTVSTEILENSIKIFAPDEKVDFDKQQEMDTEHASNDVSSNNGPEQNNNEVEYELKLIQDEVDGVSGNIELDIGDGPPENTDKIDSDEKRKYRECEICNVKLCNEDDVVRHYESLEHIRNKWGLERSE